MVFIQNDGFKTLIVAGSGLEHFFTSSTEHSRCTELASAMAYVLHATRSNKNAYKALIAAEYVGVKIETTPDFEMGVSNKTPEFLKLNPIGKVPTLETPEGSVFESNAIARYVARLKDTGLFGSSPIEMAQVEQWIDFASFEVDSNAARWVTPHFGFAPFNEETEEYVLTNFKKALATLDTVLLSRTYLVGHSVTLADIILVCNLISVFALAMTKEFTSDYPHLERYFWTLVNQPQFKKVIGEAKQTDKPLGPPPPPGQKIIPALYQQEKKHDKVPKDVPKAAKVTPKATEPGPKPAPKPAEVDVPADEEAPVKKSKNPLDLLPPSPMVMDNWKRLYSNTKAKDFHLAISGFWEMYDPEGYSLWFCDYKFNEENEVTFVTMNKVGGFLQRMDFIRKHAFSKMCILGDAAPYKIKGVWLFRGTEMPQMVKDECYDVELYEWKKVDITDEAQKALVNAYFEEPDEINGEKLLEAKCFK